MANIDQIALKAEIEGVNKDFKMSCLISLT